MFPRVQLKENAKRNFKKNYWACVLAGLVALVAEGGSGLLSSRWNLNFNVNSPAYSSSYSYSRPELPLGLIVITGILAVVIGVFVFSVITVGVSRFFVLNQTENPSVGVVFDGFRCGHYGNIVVTMFLMWLKIMLWGLLFVIPGIIKSFEYCMVPYILAENPGMDQKDVFALSKRMMDGKKMDTFVLALSFIGWEILGACTCGILAVFYVQPYVCATMAELYAFNKSIGYNEGYIR